HAHRAVHAERPHRQQLVAKRRRARPATNRRAAGAGGRRGRQGGDHEQERESSHAPDTSAGPRQVPRPYGPGGAVRSYSQRAMAGLGGSGRAKIRRAQAGSVSDFEALFREHWPRAYRAAYLVVHDAAAAEDIAQEAFLAAVRGLDRFDRRRPFGPWLHRIVVNRAIDWSRSRALRRESGDAWLVLAEAPAPPER